MARALFVCLHNAGRSQMSEVLFRQAAPEHEAQSAGTAPAQQVHPEVVEVMREIGLDVSGRQPKKLTQQMAEWADVVVTMGCGDQCPYIPGQRRIEWDLADPRERRWTTFASCERKLPTVSATSCRSSTWSFARAA